jgi:hypothetical protein
MKRRFITGCLSLCLVLGVFVTACGGPNSGSQTTPGTMPIPSGPNRSIMAGAGAGNPTGFPQPTLAPGQNDCAKIVLAGQSNSSIQLIKGKLSSPTFSSNWTVSSCDARPENLNLQYTVTSSDGFTAACGNVLTPVPAGSVTVAGNGGKGVSIQLNVPNCPGSHVFTVAVQVVEPDGVLVGRILANASTTFATSDLLGRPGVQNGVLHMTGTFVADPATSPLPNAVLPGGGPIAVTYSYNGFFGPLSWYVNVGFQTGFVGAYLNGNFVGSGSGVNNTWITQIASEPYFDPCNPQGPVLCGLDNDGFNTTIEFQDGDRVDLYPIAGDPNSVIMRPLSPAQIVGPRIGSFVLEHVPN